MGKLSRPFATQLIEIFEALGKMATSSFLSFAETKAFGDDPQQDADAVAEEIGISAVQSELQRVGGAHYLTTARRVFDVVSAEFSLSIGLPDTVAQEIVAAGGTHLGLVDLDTQTRQGLFKIIEQARSEGQGPPVIARRIREGIPAGRFTSTQIRAKLIARTETKHAQRESTVRAYQESGRVQRVVIIDDLLGHNDADCVFWNGREVTLPQARELSAQEHPNGTRDFVPVIAPVR